MMTDDVEILEAEVIEGTTGGTSLVAKTIPGMLRPVAAPTEVLEVQNETRSLIEKTLKAGRDYGVVPGTRGKPTLHKPGAERINAAFAVRAVYEIIEKESDHDHENHFYGKYDDKEGPPTTSYGLYRYVIICRLFHREANVEVGQGVGSCSSLESKYISRPRDSENTVLKMAKKRAYVDATLSTFGLSDQFTQDIEDFPRADEHDGGGGEVNDDSIMPFGKHKGKKLSEVNVDYIEWALANMDKLDPPLRQYFEGRVSKVYTPPAPEDQEPATVETYDSVWQGLKGVTLEHELAMRIMHRELPLWRSDWTPADEAVAYASVKQHGRRLYEQGMAGLAVKLRNVADENEILECLELLSAAEGRKLLDDGDRAAIENAFAEHQLPYAATMGALAADLEQALGEAEVTDEDVVQDGLPF
jgi:hypothetical protein